MGGFEGYTQQGDLGIWEMTRALNGKLYRQDIENGIDCNGLGQIVNVEDN
jgi:hypothetical protein